MTLTAPLSTPIIVSRGTLPPLAGATTGVMTGDFAGSFAKASEEAVPGLIPGATPPSAAVDMPVDALPPIPAQPTAPIAARQEWAATGKGLPIAIVGGAWPTTLVPQSPDAQTAPSPTVPAEAVLVAGRATPATARPTTTITRQALGTRARLATGSDREVAPGEADDTGEPTTADDDTPITPPVVGVPREIDGVRIVPVPLPVKAAVSGADAKSSDVAGPMPQVAVQPRIGRRNKPALAVSPVKPALAKAAPAALQTTAPLTATPTILSTAFPQDVPAEAIAATPSVARVLPGLAPESGPIALDSTSSAPTAPAVRRDVADAAVPGGAPVRGTAPEDASAIPVAGGPAPVIVEPAVTGAVRSRSSKAGFSNPVPAMPTQQDEGQPAPTLVSMRVVAESLGDGPKLVAPPTVAAIPSAATAPLPFRVRTDGAASVRSVGETRPGLATTTPAAGTASIRPTMLATATRDALGAAVLPADVQMLPRATGVVTARGIAQGESTKAAVPRSSEVAAPVALEAPLAPVQPAIGATMPAFVAPSGSSGLVPPVGAQVPPPAIAGSAEAVPNPAAPLASGTPRWTATGATTPVALAMAQPDAVEPQPGMVASAAQVFGAAIQAATKMRDADKTAESTAGNAAGNMPASTGGSTGVPDAAAVSATLAPAQPTATAPAQQAVLDMRQERWPHAMIERIEMIRDAADATDTRIRLIPDALGAIDVSVKTDGDTVHVHFNAEQAATRTLLAEAQPRLAELAEARGLKLGQGVVGDSAAGGNAGTGQQRAPATPHRPTDLPNRTARASAPTADAADDTRIA